MNQNNLLLAAIENKKDQDAFLEALASIRFRAEVDFVACASLLDTLKSASVNKQKDKREPNLILLVAELSDPSSMELIRSLKSLETVKKIPLIIVSRNHDEYQLKTAYRLGAVSVIKHPSHFESIVKILQVMDEYWFNTVRLPASRG